MFYKIHKSLGRINAIQYNSLADIESLDGLVFEVEKTSDYTRAIKIRNNGKLEDFALNGWYFPHVINNICKAVPDPWGNPHTWDISFDVLDKDSNLQRFNNRCVYGSLDVNCILYICTMFYNMSCCDSVEEFNSLYYYVFDNHENFKNKNVDFCIKAVKFIKKFKDKLDWKELNNEYLEDLEDALSRSYKQAGEIIANSEL